MLETVPLASWLAVLEPTTSWPAASCARIVVVKPKSARPRKIDKVQFGREAQESLLLWPGIWLWPGIGLWLELGLCPGLDVLFPKWGNLQRISTCGALLRCVLRGLGGRGNPPCGEQPLRVTWFPVASRLRLHRASLLATVLCADLRTRYALLVPEPSFFSFLS